MKNIDLEESSPSESLELLYEENRNELISIAIFQESGSLVAAAPALDLKTDVRPQEQQWFIRALDQIENQHFFRALCAESFQTGAEWPWVISLSRHVELTYGGETRRGVLLLDMSFSGLEKVCRNEGIPGGGGYMYIADRSGEVIYHPDQQLIYAGLTEESPVADASLSDGIHKEVIDGIPQLVW